MQVSKYGQKDVVQLFVDIFGTNIDLNALNTDGWTALRHACYNGHKDVVKSLDFEAEVDFDTIRSSFTHGP